MMCHITEDEFTFFTWDVIPSLESWLLENLLLPLLVFRPDMREVDIECKGADSPSHSCRTRVAFLARPFQSTRRRKLTAESGICHKSTLCQSFFYAKTKRAKGEVKGKNSPQKSF